MKITLAAIILSVFLPFFAFALELPPPPKISPLDNIFDSLRNTSAKIESYITPESAKEKGFWPWIREASGELFSRAAHTAGAIGEFAENRGRKAFNFILTEAKEKIGENFWSSGEAYIKNSINYIDNKIKN